MKDMRSILVFLVALFFGLSLAVPAEDVPETPYDESEVLPCESTPVFTTAVRTALLKTEPAPEKHCCIQKFNLAHRLTTESVDWIAVSLIILDHSRRC